MNRFSTNVHRIFPACWTAVNESMPSRNLFSFLMLALTATFCILPLILLNSLPQSQDMVFHVFQADQFNQNLSNGVFYPRWACGAINGYGSPNFIFYSPLSYYLVAMIHHFVHSLITSMVVAIWISFFLSGAMMFLLVNHFLQGYRGLIPAILYQILPFHMYEVYLRGSFAALFAYIWFPLILLLLFKILDAKRPALYLFCLSLAYAALIMTHLASAYMFSLTAGVFLLYFFFKRQISFVLKAVCSFGAGLGLSSIYFIPALLERQYVHMDYLTNGFGKYVNNYLFTADKLRIEHSQFSHFYTLLHLGVIADLVLFGVILLSAENRDNNPQKLSYAMFISFFILSFFFMIPLSRPLADILPGLSTLQFPWRWVAIMEVALAFLSGYIFSREGKMKISSINFFLIFIALSAVIIGTSRFYSDKTIARFENIEQFSFKTFLGVEYVPIWAPNWLDLYDGLTPEPVSFAAGEGICNVKLLKPQERVFRCESAAPSRIRIATFYYPGWETSLDGKFVPTGMEKNSGAILLDLPEGEHVVSLRFVNTPIRDIAQWSSAISLLIAITLAVALRKKEF